MKVAIVTAGGSGMGAGAARKLAEDGFKVAVLSSSGKGEALAASTAASPAMSEAWAGFRPKCRARTAASSLVSPPTQPALGASANHRP